MRSPGCAIRPGQDRSAERRHERRVLLILGRRPFLCHGGHDVAVEDIPVRSNFCQISFPARMKDAVSNDLLASFVALAEELHYTRAARACTSRSRHSPNAFSSWNACSEVPLVARTRRSVRLTAAGDLLLPRARQALRAATDFQSAASGIRDGELGLLRIGFSPSAPHRVLPTLMRAFRSGGPGVECVLTELPSDVQVDQILDGDLDAGILRPPAMIPSRLLCSTFLEEPFVVVLPRDHRFAGRRSLAIAELAHEPLA